ncbi:hypothetical protein EDB89DRAFT_1947082 [Lactarius sanguifluus]|nr:hypothetical protein EDB89DRAFT_1947082 [Lactarius sanguifluus]
MTKLCYGVIVRPCCFWIELASGHIIISVLETGNDSAEPPFTLFFFVTLGQLRVSIAGNLSTYGRCLSLPPRSPR